MMKTVKIQTVKKSAETPTKCNRAVSKKKKTKKKPAADKASTKISSKNKVFHSHPSIFSQLYKVGLKICYSAR